MALRQSKQPGDPVRDGLRVLRIEVKHGPRVVWPVGSILRAANLRQAGGPAAQDRAAAGHRFQGRKSEALVEGRKHKGAGSGVERGQFGVVHVPEQTDSPGRLTEALVPENVSRSAGDDQFDPRGLALFPGREEAAQVFAWLQRGDAQKVRLREAPVRKGLRQSRTGHGTQTILHAVVDGDDFLLGQTRGLDEPPAGKFRDGDDLTYLPHETRQHEAIPAGELAFKPLGMIERGSIVDGDHLPLHGQRSRVGGTPQQVAPQLLGQDELFPQVAADPLRIHAGSERLKPVLQMGQEPQDVTLHPGHAVAEAAQIDARRRRHAESQGAGAISAATWAALIVRGWPGMNGRSKATWKRYASPVIAGTQTPKLSAICQPGDNAKAR